MSTANQNESVKPREIKHHGSPRHPRRQFGTLLSANSPTPPRSSKKGKLFLRSSSGKRSAGKRPKAEETIEFDHQNVETFVSFTVTFDQGPIGLQLNPLDDGSCRVERFLGDQSAALLCGKIEIGDIIHSVNGQQVAYDTAIELLKDTTKQRSITFRRIRLLQDSPPFTKRGSPSIESLQTIPLDDPSTRQEQTPNHHSIRPKRLLDESVDDSAPDQTKTELAAAMEQLEALTIRVSELEDENKELRFSQKHAIQEMEFNMRLQSLENENKGLKESKAKLKKKIHDLSQGNFVNAPPSLLEENSFSLHQWEKESLEETIQILTQKLELSELNLHQSQKDAASKAQRLEEIEESGSKLEQRLEELQQLFEDSNKSSAETNQRLLESIRAKDLRIQELAQELCCSSDCVDTASEVDLNSKKHFLSDLYAEKDDLQKKVNEMTALRQASYREKENAISRATKFDELNRTIDVDLQNQNDQLQKEKAKIVESLEQSEKTNNSTQQENAHLRAIIAKLNDSMEELSAQKTQIQDTAKTLEARLEAQCTLSAQRQSNLAETIDKLESTEKENELLRNDAVLAKTRTNETYSQLEQVERDFFAADQRWSERFERLKIENEKVLNELDEVKKISEGSMESLESVRQELNVQNIEAEATITELRDTIHVLVSENQTKLFEKDQAQEALIVTRQLLKDRYFDEKVLNERLEELTSSVDCLSEQLSREKASRCELLVEKNELVRDNVIQQNRQRQQSMVLMEEHAVEIGKLQGKLDVLECKNTELQIDKSQLEHQLADSINARQIMEADAKAIEYQLVFRSNLLQEENTRIKRQILAYASAGKVLTLKYEEAERLCSSLYIRLDEQEANLLSLENAKTTLANKLSIEETKIQQMIQEHQKAVVERDCFVKSLKEKEDKIIDLSNETRVLNFKLAQEVEKTRQLESEVLQIQRQLSGRKQYYENDRARLQKRIDEATRTIKAHSAEHDALQVSFRKLRDQLDQSDKTRASLNNEILNYRARLKTSNDENRELEAHAEKLKTDIKERRDRDSAKTRELRELREKHEVLQQLHQDLTKLYNESLDSLKRHEGETMCAERHHQSVVFDLERKLEKGNADVALLRTKLEETSRSHTFVVADLRTELKSLESNKLRLTTEHSSLQTKCRAFADTIKKLEIDIETKNTTVENLEKEIFIAKESLALFEDEAEKHLEKISSLQDQLQSSEAKQTDFAQKIEHATTLLKESRDKAAREHFCYQQTIDDLKKSSSEFEMKLQASEDRLKHFENETAIKDTQLQLYDERLKEIHDQLQAANDHIFNMTAQRSKDKNNLKAQADRLQAIKIEKDSLEESMKDLRHEYSIHCSESQKRELELTSRSDSLHCLLEEEKRQRGVLEAELLQIKDEKSRDSFKVSMSDHSEKQRRLDFLIQLKDDQIIGLNKECEDNAKLIEELRHRNSDLHSKVLNLEQCLENTKTESTRKIEEIICQCKEDIGRVAARLSEENRQLEQQLDVAMRNKTDIEKQLSTLASSMSNIDSVNKSTKADIFSLQQENELLRCQLRESIEALTEFQVENANLSQSSEDSVQTSSPYKCLTKQDWKIRCMNLESDLEQAEDRIDLASQEIGLRSTQIKQLSENLSKMTSEVHNLTKANDVLEMHLRESWSNKEKAECTVDHLERQNMSLVNELNCVKHDLSTLKQSIQSETESLKSENQNQLRTIEELKLSLSSVESTKEDLEHEVLQSTSAISDLKRELTSLHQQHSYVNSQYQATKELCERLRASNVALRDDLSNSDRSKNDFIDEASRMRAEISEKNDQLEKIQDDLRDAVRAIQDKERECRALEASTAVLGQNLEKTQILLASTNEEKSLAITGLRESKQVAESQVEEIALLQQEIVESREKVALLSQQLCTLKTTAEQVNTKNTQDLVASYEHVQSLELKCETLRNQITTLQDNERIINGKLIESRRQQAANEKSNSSMKHRIETLKSNIKALRGQLEDARSARKKSDLRCGQLESSIVEKQMEIDQLKTESHILQSAAAQFRSGSTLQSHASGSLHCFDPMTKPASDESHTIVQAMNSLNDTLGQIEQCFDAIVSTTSTICSGKIDLPWGFSLQALDLATSNSDPCLAPSLTRAFKNLSDIVAQTQSHLTNQKHFIQSLRICVGRTSDLNPSLLVTVTEYEKQLDILLIDLQAANNALAAKDKVIENMHDVSLRREEERRELEQIVTELQDRLKLDQLCIDDAEQELAKTSCDGEKRECDDNDGTLIVACKRAAVHLLLHAVEKRTFTAKSVAFRQWACYASAQKAMARQNQIASVLSDQLQETREKLKILKKHMKKSRRSPPNTNLGTIAETSKDDDSFVDL